MSSIPLAGRHALALILTAVLTSGCATPCESANADQDDPALQTCAFVGPLSPDGPTAIGTDDGAPVAMTIPAFDPDREPRTLPDGTRLVDSYVGLSWDGTGGDLSPADTASGVTSEAVASDAYALGMTTGGRIRWIATSGDPIADLQVPEGMDPMLNWPNRAKHLALAPDGSTLVAADALHTVIAWDPSGAVRWQKSVADEMRAGDHINAVTVSPDGRLVAVATRYAVSVWGAASGEPVARWEHPGKTPISDVFFSDDGAYLAVRKPGRYNATNTRVTTRDHTNRQTNVARTVDSGPSQSAPNVIVWRLP